jgi:hypothetical protein
VLTGFKSKNPDTPIVVLVFSNGIVFVDEGEGFLPNALIYPLQ